MTQPYDYLLPTSDNFSSCLQILVIHTSLLCSDMSRELNTADSRKCLYRNIPTCKQGNSKDLNSIYPWTIESVKKGESRSEVAA